MEILFPWGPSVVCVQKLPAGEPLWHWGGPLVIATPVVIHSLFLCLPVQMVPSSFPLPLSFIIFFLPSNLLIRRFLSTYFVAGTED